jgi:peptidyl-prolyl cis-trans isomerase A (cyclophilin A)
VDFVDFETKCRAAEDPEMMLFRPLFRALLHTSVGAPDRPPARVSVRALALFVAVFALLGLAAGPLAQAQTKPRAKPAATAPKPPVTAPKPAPKPVIYSGVPHVALETTAGTIVLRIEADRAPLTAANFLKYVDTGRYNGQPFYRTTRNWGADSTLIQMGVRTDGRLVMPPVAHEPTTTTGLMHCPGSLSLARGAPGTGTSDIFLALGPIYGFDANPAAARDNPGTDTAGFAVFGELVGGWAVAQDIAAAPVSDTLGMGVMKGQMLAAPVVITRAVRVPPPAGYDPAKPKPGCVVKTPAADAAAPKS